jgi:pilin isopeptide linkage protein
MADKNRTQQKAPHGKAKAHMTGKRALAFMLSVLLAWMLAMPSVTSATTDDGTGVEEVAAATTQEEGSVSSKAADTDSSTAATADASANDSSAAASGSASETSADSKTSSSDTAQNSAAASENVSGGGASEAGSDDASTSEESSSVAEESAAKAAPALEDTNSATQVSGEEGLSVAKNSGTYQLSGDVYQTSTVTIAGNTTVDLNGHSVYYKGNTQLFDVKGGTLTIKDSNPATDTKSEAEAGTANVGSITYNGTAPKKVTYYVTESNVNPNGISTTETRYQHTVTPGGVITAEANNGANSVISMTSGELNIEGGTICMPHSESHGSDCHIIYAGGGKFNLRGGYIAGGKRTSNWGGGVCLTGNAVLNMSGGVITANEAKAGAGVYAAQGTTVNMTDDKAVISGNTVVAGTYDYKPEASDGYGGGIYAVGATVNVSGGYITNNRVNASYKDRHQGLIGGGGIAIMNDSSQASLAISGGYITENYSKEAGGGIYAGRYKKGLGEHFTLTGGTIASNVAQNSEGGGIRISEGTTANFSVASGSHAYITNNYCNSQDDWGGGGVFVQKDGYLYVKNSLVTDNASGGYGAGVAACPTGETVITHTSGAAIYGNNDDVDGDSPHFSTVNDYGKHEDYDVASIDTAFTSHGHADYFLVREKSSDSYVTAVTGRMLGGGAAGWSGSVDGKAVNKVDANSGIEAKYLVGMTADPTDSAKDAGIHAATLIFSGNYAYNHGGGIMTNGGLTIGEVKNIDIYPGLKLNAKKALMQDGESAPSQLTERRYTFVLLSPSSSNGAAPSWNTNGTLNYGDCTESARTTNKAGGSIEFNVSSEYSQSGTYTYYVAELPNDGDADATYKTDKYDKTIYKITATLKEDESQRTTLLDITFKHYTISDLTVTPITDSETGDSKQGSSFNPSTTMGSDNSVEFTLSKDGDTNNKAAFSNELKPYETTGSFTPEVTKHVEGGEVKEFTFQLFDADGYNGGKWDGAPLQTKTTEKSDSSDATVTFNTIPYKLGVSDLTGGKGGTKTYDYYIREQSGAESGYTYDSGYIKVHVTVIDNSNGSLTVDPAYTYCKADGTPTKKGAKFDNKYAQSLPNAGQAGIALAYAAGGAALAYGLWRLVKSRQESRKGGDER